LPYTYVHNLRITWNIRRVIIVLVLQTRNTQICSLRESVSLRNLMLCYVMLRPLHLVFIDIQKFKQFFFFAHQHVVKRTTRLQRPNACHNCMKQCGSNWQHVARFGLCRGICYVPEGLFYRFLQFYPTVSLRAVCMR
jgi:hypothetical protein